MKSILFTVASFKNFAGSELVTLSQVNYFLEKGWRVDVFTLEYDFPLKEKVDSKVTVITLDNLEDIQKDYDLIIARQYPLLDYVLFTLRVKGKRVYYESVSYRIPIDAYPIYYKHLTLIGAVSINIINQMNKYGYDTTDVYYMPNYASKDFFDINHKYKNEPNKIAIVSNHVPKELEEFKTYTESVSNIKVDIYGEHHTYTLITPEVLNEYDVIISIAKTVFYAIAMGIPCYTYDEDFTEGYITLDNYKENLMHNFAHGLGDNKKSAREIYEDITNNYSSIIKQSTKLKEYAKNDFYFDTVMDKLYDEIMKREEVNYDVLYKKYSILEYTSRTYIEDRDFLKKQELMWYHKSLELGDLYQKEIGKTVDALGKYEVLLESYNSILNSKGWKLLEKVKKIKKR